MWGLDGKDHMMYTTVFSTNTSHMGFNMNCLHILTTAWPTTTTPPWKVQNFAHHANLWLVSIFECVHSMLFAFFLWFLYCGSPSLSVWIDSTKAPGDCGTYGGHKQPCGVALSGTMSRYHVCSIVHPPPFGFTFKCSSDTCFIITGHIAHSMMLSDLSSPWTLKRLPGSAWNSHWILYLVSHLCAQILPNRNCSTVVCNVTRSWWAMQPTWSLHDMLDFLLAFST